MEPSNNESTSLTTEDQTEHIDLTLNWSTASIDKGDRILLNALQGFIVPHIQAVVNSKQKIDKIQTSMYLEHEAERLLQALKEFITSIVGSHAPTDKPTIKVSLDGDLDTRAMEDFNDDVIPRDHEADRLEEVVSHIAKPTFHDKVLHSLRDNVFNTMPIRLLRFEPQGTCLQISLIERDAIYLHIASLMQKRIHDTDYRRLKHETLGTTETEDEAIDRVISKYGGYAILSHTWLHEMPGEVTYSSWNNGLFDKQDAGYTKLVNFCKSAWKHYGLTLGWMDTICINKDSSSELDESIRSMYSWYEHASVCIVYLSETRMVSSIHRDPWFTRGWTLQELLAPKTVKVYNRNWERFMPLADNDKTSRGSSEIRGQIMKATSLSQDELRNIRVFASLSRRMQLAAPRKVTREEDTAYSLMGIFDVSISTAYGEGAQSAFFRLLQQILNSTSYGILDLFNWAGGKQSSIASNILPVSPRAYVHRTSSINLDYLHPIEPLMLTHMGLRIPLLLMPGISIDGQAFQCKPIGDYTALTTITPNQPGIPTTYSLLDQRAAGSDGPPGRNASRYQYTFAVFNVQQGAPRVVVPQKCIAIPISCTEDVGQVTSMGAFYRIHTKSPVLFTLEKAKTSRITDNDVVSVHDGISLAPNELERHGMQLVTKYL